MRYPQSPLRDDRRANVGFAVVAVALLVVGGAAALYLESVEHPPTAGGPRGPVAAEAHRVAEAVSAMAHDVLDGALAEGLPEGGLDGLARTVWARLNRSLASHFPRAGTSGMTVGASIATLSVTTDLGAVVAPSVFGGNSAEELPIWAVAQGVAEVTFAGTSGSPRAQAVAFAGRSSLPVALPFELAARADAELLPGGLAERFASQAAQHLLRSANVSAFDGSVAPAVVRAAVRATVLWAFHASGSATFDALALSAAGGDRMLTAGGLYNRTEQADEPIDLTAAGSPFTMAGGRSVSLRVLDYSDGGLTVSVTRRGFSGQEVGEGVWQAVTVSVRGALSLTAEVSTGGSSTRVGPLRLPVAFDARAAAGPFAPELVVPPEMIALIEQQARHCGAACQVTAWLAGGGLSINTTAAMTAAVEHALYDFAEAQMTAGLPPVEDANRFMEAYGAPRRSLNPQWVSIVGPPVADGAPASFTVDGAPAGSATVHGGQATLPRAPDGAHTLGVSVPCGDGVCAGGAPADFADGAPAVAVPVAPAPREAFLSAVARRALFDNLTLGAAALLEASALLGLPAGDGEPGVRLDAALTRADALLSAGVPSATFRAALEDARGFLKVSTLVLKATDAARKAVGGASAPLAQAVGNGATLVIAPETRLLLVATVHGSEVLRAAFSNGSLELSSPWTAGGERHTLDFRLEQVGLVATAALAGLTLGADVVRLQQESAEGDGLGYAIATGKFAAHTADTLRELTQGLMRVADRFLGTAAAEAAATAFAKASVVLGAVFLALELADLYHDAGGNLTLMAEGLLHPASVAGIATLPSLAQAAASTAAGAILLMSGEAMAAAGPIGIAAGLFVLAGVIVLNGQTFASAAFGSLNPEDRVAFESAMGNRTRDLAHVLAYANGLNPAASEAAARASSLAAARPGSGRDEAVQNALRYSERAAAERALRHAALAAMEQMDDFASGNHTADPGRRSEGYGQLEKVDANQGGWGRFPYGGDLVVQDSSPAGTHTLSRPEWRSLLPTLVTADLAHITFGYRLTPTDGIPVEEAKRFVGACAASGSLLSDLLAQYRALGS